MITIVTVWLCLIAHVACDVVITVNNSGSDNDTCCVNGTCPCSSLSSALHNVSDNTVINITSESVTLHDIVGMGSDNLNNITITGNGATIMCNNTGGVYCESCSDITIMGITWYQCGGNDYDPFTAFTFINSSSEILIKDCTFRNCSVYINVTIIVKKPVIKLLNVNAYGNENDIKIYGGANGYVGTVSLLSSTFINVLYIQVDTVNILSTVLNDYRYTIIAHTVNVSSVTFVTSHLLIITEQDNSSIEISHSIFYDSIFERLIYDHGIYNSSECIRTSIVLADITIYNIRDIFFLNYAFIIYNENDILSVMLKDITFTSNRVAHALLYIHNNYELGSCSSSSVSIQFTNCTFDKNFALNHVVAFNFITGYPGSYDHVTIELSDCNFDKNFVGESIVYVNYPGNDRRGLMILDNLTFSNNNCTTLYLIIFQLLFKGSVQFINNSAINGAGVYMDNVNFILFDDNAIVQFINNSAEQKGGAMYINLANLFFFFKEYCNVFENVSDTSIISFTNNSAKVAGNSIYFNIPQSCQIITNVNSKHSLLYYTNKFRYSESFYTRNPPIVTSPYNITLYPPATATYNVSNGYLIQESKMLGEPIQIIASVFDYFNNIAEPVTFSIDCEACGDEYILSTYLISVHNQSMYELKIFPTAAKDVISNTNISITFLSALASVYRSINDSLLVTLSQCRAGYLFDSTQRQCVCYSHSDLVHCKGYYVEIKIGYWIGNLTRQHYTSSICPKNYCSSEHTETSPGYYSLHGKSDDQCISYRTGVACGECKSGYTLAYDSPDCINTDKSCSAGMTILVIVLTILYWIAIVAVVFGLMYFQFQISSGYAYGIIYYYSIVDIILVNDVSVEIFQFVGILSSFAKLTPQLFGQLCLVEGLSGIDQQFIHYSHALAVSLILLIIVLVARYSPRLTQFVGRCIIRVICLLLLLSYTSLASISLQLLRPLTFKDVYEVRTYSSPDIKYFTGRHLVYAIVAILCEVIIVIGLPLFLLFEPFLRRRTNLVRIKPLLDQFQGCYKDKYRWFAAYYLICRQVIILIVYVGSGNYYYMLYGLQTACVIIAMIHGVVQPYKNNLLNGLDEVILVILVLIVNLNLFSLSSFIPTNYFSVILVILPLLLICFIAIRKLINHFLVRKKRELQLYNPVGTHEENDRNNERR